MKKTNCSPEFRTQKNLLLAELKLKKVEFASQKGQNKRGKKGKYGQEIKATQNKLAELNRQYNS